MRFDKWTLVYGAAAVVLAVVLGWLAGEIAGALPGAVAGALTALSGAAFAVFWQIASARGDKVQARNDQLSQAGTVLALPRGLEASPAGYLRAEERVVSFRSRREFVVLRDWVAADGAASVRLVTGAAGSGKTRLAIELAAEAAGYGYRCY